MSEMSERVERALESEYNQGNALGPIRSMETLSAPGFGETREHFNNLIVGGIRRSYRFHGGEDLPGTGEETLSKFRNEIIAANVEVSGIALSAGILVGQGTLLPVRKARALDQWEGLFHSKAFVREVELQRFTLADDAEVEELLVGYTTNAIDGMGHMTGFNNSTKDTHKIWDLWALAANSCSAAFYLAGARVGKEWHEDDVLRGIAEATKEEGTDGPA